MSLGCPESEKPNTAAVQWNLAFPQFVNNSRSVCFRKIHIY